MTNQKTKIIYCITKSDWGGAQRYVYDLATTLPRDQYEVSVILGNDGTLAHKLEAVGIKTHFIGTSRDVSFGKDFLSLFRLIRIFRKEKPDIIHLNSSKMGGLGTVAGKIARVPKIIFTGHGWAFNEERSQFQKKMIYLLHSLTVSLADRTIAVSEKTKEQLMKSGESNRKIQVIKNGIEGPDFFDQDLARAKLAQKLPVDIDLENRTWLGTISELHKNKGLKYLIEAMHLLEVKMDEPSALPVLIIIGEGERREKLQERINRYNLQKNIFLIGRIDEAAKYLKAFNIFTLTSITEALPYAILEAGLAGLGVIASGVGGIPEIIDDMVSGILVRPKEPEEIEKALTFLLNNPDKIKLFGQKLREKVSSDFNREKMIEKTLALYKDM